ncbi:glycosyltransferase family 4 protein [Leptospira sp. 2 VSF19]|uniref:Glycosyltransferase family 4 protein n=1 Tax=Leptospira soteropolitanensis TaxID=2950025 RepID=A0AAW5VI41_9LEPT|nr:glycosyltransferase family 1 protein [Leptospira soteropolitanensis]MCW7493191.1 glycosyltransferase family 4 protein [Leptospira soteropolitanensis]MCW7500740.1 glycosyltransferase family 4 protein [Leptospira soteropolitanensis]MCW7523041.1 glycosyltransferase family 4 protein [Leptospira soteropolitanensis]MCW7526852.1 glycosyltransferase family 4 protein [Leptospira soteropolitanensis]MCW7530759.1 glycosyltransferase family 4 protein [Leptospira soteropolitanensis]
MKIIFDISILAWSVRSNKAKTGIFRVIENLLNESIHQKDFELYLSSVQGNICSFYEYLENHNIRIQSDRLLVPRKYSKSKDKVFLLYLWVLNLVDFKRKVLYKFFIPKIIQSILDPLLMILGMREYLYPIRSEFLNEEFIFHSPYLPFPAFIKNSKIRKVIFIHDLIPILYPEFFVSNRDNVVWKIIRDLDSETNIITNSEFSKLDIIKSIPNINKDRINVVLLGCDKVFHEVESDFELDKEILKYGLKNKKYILTVSTLEPRKNLKSSIRAFVRLVEEGLDPEIKFVILGGRGWGVEFGTLESEYPDVFKNRIIFLGFISDEEMALIYSGALFFVYLSLYEGFGLPPLEAMKSGLPVIVSNTSSLPEVVGEAGVLVDPRDEDEIFLRMKDLVTSRGLRRKLSLKSRKQASLFSWEKSVLQLKKIYQNILK